MSASERVERILRKHGASEIEQERDWLVASWFVGVTPRCAVRMVVGHDEVEEIDLEYVSYATTVAKLEEVARVLTAAAAAAREIEAPPCAAGETRWNCGDPNCRRCTVLLGAP
jgi:hypothetical protein